MSTENAYASKKISGTKSRQSGILKELKADAKKLSRMADNLRILAAQCRMELKEKETLQGISEKAAASTETMAA